MASHEEQMFWAPCELENWPEDQPVVGWSSGSLIPSPQIFETCSLAVASLAVAVAAALLEE